jgi:hypothetical protein
LVGVDAYLLSDKARTPFTHEIETDRLDTLRLLNERRQISIVVDETYSALAGLEDHRGVAPPQYRHDQVEECAEHSKQLFQKLPPPGTKPTVANCEMKPTNALPRPSENSDPKTKEGMNEAMISQWLHTGRVPPSGRRADTGGGHGCAAVVAGAEDTMNTTDSGGDEPPSESTTAGRPHSHFMVCDEAVFAGINGMRNRAVEHVVGGLPPCDQGKEEEVVTAAIDMLKWSLNTVVILARE